MDIRTAFPFRIIGIDSDNGSGSINWHLLRWCELRKATFTGHGSQPTDVAKIKKLEAELREVKRANEIADGLKLCG